MRIFKRSVSFHPLLFSLILTILVMHANCKEPSTKANRYKGARMPLVKIFKNNKNNLPPGNNNYYYLAVPPNKMAERRPIDVKRKSVSHEEKGASEHEVKTQEKEVDTTLDDLLEVMGPHLFLVPFVLKILPFAIPALPLSYILSRYEPATIQELINRLMELSTQLTELFQQGNTPGGQEG